MLLHFGRAIFTKVAFKMSQPITTCCNKCLGLVTCFLGGQVVHSYRPTCRGVVGPAVGRVFQLAGIGLSRARRSYSYSSVSYSGESLGLCPYWVIVC